MENPLIRLEPGLFIWTIITFLVLVAALVKFAWKPLMEALDRREKRIRQSLQDAEKARKEAERISREYEGMIRQAREEAQAIVSQGKSTAEKQKEMILRDAKEQSERIQREAEKQIKAEKESAIAAIRREAVNLSLYAASKIIGKNLTKKDNLSLINKSLDRMKDTDA